MSQDTRKDQRARVVSLNVRYKSATVDEFIENHSHDVSRGGIFVKTPTPFAPGTLLKFEIRLAGDKSVIAGVGRVVWKREPTQAGADKPAGMGVKFIKVDDGSRVVIDRLVEQKADAGSAYESDLVHDGSEPLPAGGNVHPSTLRGLAAAPPAADARAAHSQAPAPRPAPVIVPSAGISGTKLPVPPVASPTPAPAKPVVAPPSSPESPPVTASAKPTPIMTGAVAPPPPSSSVPRPSGAPAGRASEAPRPVNPRKATMMGVGTLPPTSPASVSTDGVDEVLGNLESLGEPFASPAPAALAGTTPTPRTAEAPAPKAASPVFSSFTADAEPVREPTVMKQAAELLEEALREAGGSLEEIGQNPLFAGLVSGASGASGAKPAPEEPVPVSVRVQSGDTVVMGSPSAPPPPVTSSSMSPSFAPMPAAGASQSGSSASSSGAPSPLLKQPAPAKRSSAGLAVALLGVLVLAGGGVFAWQTGMFAGGGVPVPPTPTPMPTPTPTPIPRDPVDAAAAASAAAPPASAMAVMQAADAAVEAVVDAGKTSGTASVPVAEKPEPPKPVAPAPVRRRPRPAGPAAPVAAPTGETPADTKPEPKSESEPETKPEPISAPPSPAPDPN
jgi:uncharacterized protein (TIGR02266 family)